MLLKRKSRIGKEVQMQVQESGLPRREKYKARELYLRVAMERSFGNRKVLAS